MFLIQNWNLDSATYLREDAEDAKRILLNRVLCESSSLWLHNAVNCIRIIWRSFEQLVCVYVPFVKQFLIILRPGFMSFTSFSQQCSGWLCWVCSWCFIHAIACSSEEEEDALFQISSQPVSLPHCPAAVRSLRMQNGAHIMRCEFVIINSLSFCRNSPSFDEIPINLLVINRHNLSYRVAGYSTVQIYLWPAFLP